MAVAIRRGTDLRIYTEFRHNEHVDTKSTSRELIKEVADFRITYLLDDRWVAGIESEKSISSTMLAHRVKGWNVEYQVFHCEFHTAERRDITEILEMPRQVSDALDPTSWDYNHRTPEERHLNTNETICFLADVVSK